MTDPFGHWPDRTPLYDDDELMLVFTLAESARDDRRWVDLGWRPPTTAVERARDAVLDAFAGYAFTSLDPLLAQALLDAGATELRHAHSMSHPLTETSIEANDVSVHEPAADVSLSIEPLTATSLLERADELGAVKRRAYPPGHPDHELDDPLDAVEELRQIARGEVLGPYLDVSTAASLGGDAIGACLVVRREGEPPEGGPWIVNVFRDPSSDVAGVGGALIAESLRLASKAGLAGLSLVVSHDNVGARRVYRRLGFVDGLEAWTLALP